MKIALYAPSWPPGSAANGIVTYASHLVPALRQLGHEVFVLTRNMPAGYADTDPHTIDLRRYLSKRELWDKAVSKISPATGSFNAVSRAIASAIVELVNKHKIDVFEIEESFGWSLATTRKNLVPVVVRLHGPWALYGKFSDADKQTPLNFGRVEREGKGIQHASFVTANCNDTLQGIRSYYGLDLEKSCIIPTPIDAASERSWDVKACDPDRLLFVGRFDKLKGAELILRSFFELASSNPKLRLTFVGTDSGIEGSDGKVRRFEEYVQKNFPEWFRSRIEFRGQLSRTDLMSLRPKHLITLIAAQIDTMGYMVLEPMSLGCPFVTTAVGGIPEFIKDGHNGLLVPSQDVGAMVNACLRLLSDHQLAAQIGGQAWLDCRNLYNSENVAMRTLAAYEQAVKAFSASSTHFS